MPRVIITAPEQVAQPYRFPLDREVVSLGRGSENDIVIDCGSVSTRHAEMVRVEGGYELRDLGSTNGIALGQGVLPVISLVNGMTVKLGDVSFDFELTEDEQAVLAGEEPKRVLPPLVSQAEGTVLLAEEPPLSSPGRGGGVGMALVFVVLALLAFAAGVAIRHQKETGRSLLEELRQRGQPAEAPAVPQEGAD